MKIMVTMAVAAISVISSDQLTIIRPTYKYIPLEKTEVRDSIYKEALKNSRFNYLAPLWRGSRDESNYPVKR